MSAEISDVARIQDEDVLRKMWQETDDFGRKKEIRSHMYKLREARLKDFYNSADVTSEVRQSSSQKVSKMSTTHADALADQSYVTLKSKEVRDSESPTRDSYKAVKTCRDQGWNVESSHQKSEDGKLHTSTHTASTSGTQQIEGGTVDYAAKIEERASVFQDGNTRAAGTASQSVVHQEASGGDESSNFRSSSNKTSSSSRYVSETKSSSEMPSIDESNAKSVVQKTYTGNIPSDLKSHPSYVEGKTKVTQETKTLADGTVVTTTRYETKEGNSTRSATHKKYSNMATSRSAHEHREDKAVSGQSSQTTKVVHESSRKLEDTPAAYATTTTKTTKTRADYVDIPVEDFTSAQTITSSRSHQDKTSKTSADYVEIPVGDFTRSQTKITTSRSHQDSKTSLPAAYVTTTKTSETGADYVEIPVEDFTRSQTKTTTSRSQQDSKTSVDQFIATERQKEIDTRSTEQPPKQREPALKPQKVAEPSPKPQKVAEPSPKQPAETQSQKPAEPYVQPDKRQPIRPGKSELDERPAPTEGQYSTTYRSEFTNKKISVEVSATHDAFARSLRSVTPERISRSSPRCGSNSSLRNTVSPEKNRYPSRSSPDRSSRSRSPKKSSDRFSSNETFVYTTSSNRRSPTKSPDRFTSTSKTVSDDSRRTSHYSTDTVTRKSKTVDSGTVTRRTSKPRSPSPTETTSSDFEYKRYSKDITTDLDVVDRESVTNKRPSSLDISTRKTKKVTERSPTSPLSPQKSPVKEERPKLIRTDTYEERVKEILGLNNKEMNETRKSSLERNSLKRSSLRSVGSRTTSSDDVVKRLTKTSSPRTSPEKFTSQVRKAQTQDRKSPGEVPKKSSVSEFPAQIRKSPERVPSVPYPEKTSTSKHAPGLSEFPSQISKSPERTLLQPYPEKSSPKKQTPKVSEFPAQIRKSPERVPLQPYPEKSSPSRKAPGVSEFPAQVRKTPERTPVEPYPQKSSPTKHEFLLQTRKSPERATPRPYSEKSSPSNEQPTDSESPAQIRKSPERTPLEPYPQRMSPTKQAPTICEFPSQIRKSPERKPLEPYPEKSIPSKKAPSVSEFPAQIRKSPEKEPLEPYPEKSTPTKQAPTICEFPSQIRKSPEKKPLEHYPERTSPEKAAPGVAEFPAQIRKSPEREPLEPYPEKSIPSEKAPSVTEFPAQIRKSPEKEPLEPYPEKSTPTKQAPTIGEFPSQIRKSPEKEPLEPYPERTSPAKKAPGIAEFPAQIRKSPEKEPLEPYPEKSAPAKQAPTICEFPSQIRKSLKKEPLEPYPEKSTPAKKPTSVAKIPAQDKKSPLEPCPQKTPSKKKAPSISEFPAQIKKSPGRAPLEPYPEKTPSTKKVPGVSEFPSQVKKSPGRTPLEPFPAKSSPTRQAPTISEFSSQTRRSPERVTFDLPATRTSPARLSSVIAPRKTKTSSESSSTSEVEEKATKTTNRRVETRIPVSEPIVEKKIFSQLCKADEKKITNAKKQTQQLIETEKEQSRKLVNGVSKTKLKTPVKVTPTRKPSEKVEPKKPVQVSAIAAKTPTTSKKSPTMQPGKIATPKRQPQTIYKVEKTKFVGVNELSKKTPLKKTTLCHVEVTDKLARVKTPQKKTTLYDLEVSSKLTQDKGIHVRTNRVDDTVTRKKVSKTVTLNGHATPSKKTTVTVSSRLSTPKKATSKPTVKESVCCRTSTCCKKETDGYTSSESDDLDSVEGSFIDLTSTNQDKKDTVITTKTVLITNDDDGLDREVIVNLQRSKSSREPTPDRLCPRPLTSDEEDDDYSAARYPDQISEPDERKPKKLADLPIFESDDNLEDSRIVDVTEAVSKITKVDRVEETDESLLSVNKKIHKFLNTAEQLTKEPVKPRPEKVERPALQVTEDLREDECLLSVSDKVSKFINTAEKLTSTTLPDKPKSPDFPKKGVSDKVSKFIITAEKLTTSRQSPEREATFTKTVTNDFIRNETTEEVKSRKAVSPERSPSPGEKTPNCRPSNQYTSILRKESLERSSTRDTSPETPKTTSRLSQEDSKISTATRLRTNESIKRAKALFENKEDTRWTKDVLDRPSVFEARRLKTDENLEISTKSSLKNTASVTSRRTPSPKKSPERKPSSGKIEITRFRSRSRSPDASTPSTDVITAKIRSREPTPDGDAPHYMKPLDRGTKVNEITRFRSRSRSPELLATNDEITQKIRSREPTPDRDLPHYMKPLDRNVKANEITRFRSRSRTPEDLTEKIRSREPTPDRDVPHYMTPLDRSVKPNIHHRDTVNHLDQDTRQSKFGVTLKRTETGRTSTETSSSTAERRKSSITLEKRITEEEVEEIFDLEVLEELLEKVMGYELRRKIRTQIRLVKRLITEGTLEEYVSKRTTRRGPSPSKTSKTEHHYVRKTSPERKPSGRQTFEHTDLVDRRSSAENTITEYKSSYSTSERKSSTSTTRSSLSPERRTSKTVDVTPAGKTTTRTTVESIPGGTRTTTTKTTEKTFATLKKAAPPARAPVEDVQPEWVRQRNLRNARDSAVNVTTKSSGTFTSTSKKERMRSSPLKEVKGTDLITSSYGVGPTDENGAPLFGLKALRAQNKNEKSKVQGTVIRSEYYSENDKEPVGQVSVTKYSTDPRDLRQEGVVSTDGKISSVTTTQKFGYRDTPSLKSLTGNKKEICDTTEKSTTKTSKINRRGSVKEISKKFIDNAVESIKSERQTTYPKAGLILRTSSFKSTNGDAELDSPGSPSGERKSSCVTKISTVSSSGETFLSNKSKISGVQDVLTRMKNEERVEGESEEDIAARGLLNKFIGSQVILSGMEACAKASKTKTATITASPTVSVRRTTKITTTITEGGKPTTKTRIFQRPVTQTELETVWDEQSLRLLLEQSTDYEERRIVRARLRQIMAELEACTVLVDEALKGEEPKTLATPTASGQLEESTVDVGNVPAAKVTAQVPQQARAPKPMSPFAKFRQLDKQNSINKPTPPSTPGTPRGAGPLFKFTDPALTQSANTIKDRLLHWCRMKTKEYENIQLDNFSSSWADGLAFCALIHHFLPDAFDYSALTPKERRHNFELAFRIADEKADIFPLLDVEDMLETRRPDWKCVFTYVQSIYRRFKDED